MCVNPKLPFRQITALGWLSLFGSLAPLGAAAAPQLPHSPQSHSPQPQSLQSHQSPYTIESIYGEDSRKNVAELLNPAIKIWARSVVSLVKSQDLSVAVDHSGEIRFSQTYGQYQDLCPGTPFENEPVGAFCTGTLVGPDLVLTAKHCVADEDACAKTSFVFDFAIDRVGRNPLLLPKNSIYSCSEIIKRYSAAPPVDGSRDFTEYALVRLSRPVTDRSPLPIRRTGEPELGNPLVSIGSTMGLPLKVATGSVLALDSNHTSFRAAIDTFTGNSGGPLINAVTGEVEGVLARGMDDLNYDDGLQCNHEATYAEADVPGEVATLASTFAAEIPELPPSPATTCSLRTIQYRIDGLRPPSLAGQLLPTDLRKLDPTIRGRLGEVARKYKSKIAFESTRLTRLSALSFEVTSRDPLCRSGSEEHEIQVRTGTGVTALQGRDLLGRPIPGAGAVKSDEFYLFDTFQVR